MVSETAAYLVIALVVSGVPDIDPPAMHARAAAHTSLAKGAMALAAYRLERGAYPEELGELVPDYLPDLPLDPFAEGALAYGPRDGGYVLSSIGPDVGAFGGKARKKRPDEYVVRVD